jgi:protoheme IX farnesyltransferase
VFNNWIDRDIDRAMARTRDRVLAKGLMSPAVAVVYAALLGLAGLGVLWTAVNGLCVVIVAVGLGIYVVAYSMLFKRRSVHGALIGSLAGAAPALAGYCAAAGRFDWGAVILLSIFSLWQMPHALAIAVSRFDDYMAADIPVVPIQRGIPAAKKQIAVYILAFTAAALALTLGGYAGHRFLWVAIAAGLGWLGLACWGYRSDEHGPWARRLFVFSIAAITLLCAMMAVDFTGTSPIPVSLQSHLSGVVPR